MLTEQRKEETEKSFFDSFSDSLPLLHLKKWSLKKGSNIRKIIKPCSVYEMGFLKRKTTDH